MVLFVVVNHRNVQRLAIGQSPRSISVSCAAGRIFENNNPRRRDGEERRGSPERSMSSLLRPMVDELARQDAMSRPTSAQRASSHLAAMRHRVAEARREREDASGEG